MGGKDLGVALSDTLFFLQFAVFFLLGNLYLIITLPLRLVGDLFAPSSRA